MNDTLRDIELLTVVRDAVNTGGDKATIVSLLDKVILAKKIEITTFEHEMEKEFAKDGFNSSQA